ncbi:Cyclic pyranopterin monophosphate synthase, mitochondrial [Boothiomyces sp. JEL0838]|nr:Cyclic pyranopterin monophosphate synthase, mitochondrial [Boothiomyces sp. JEL0838]
MLKSLCGFANLGSAVYLFRNQVVNRSEKQFFNYRNVDRNFMLGRYYSSLTHVNESGKASMVDITAKSITSRTAHAQGKVMLGRDAFYAVKDNQVKKGDVLTVAQIAGIQAAKQTSNLIPLCHQVNLSKVELNFSLNEADHSVLVESKAVCDGKTGVEMEAIIAVSVAACTIYDMCKAINKGIEITDIFLISKYGGKGPYER